MCSESALSLFDGLPELVARSYLDADRPIRGLENHQIGSPSEWRNLRAKAVPFSQPAILFDSVYDQPTDDASRRINMNDRGRRRICILDLDSSKSADSFPWKVTVKRRHPHGFLSE